jgi:hypothetical protein
MANQLISLKLTRISFEKLYFFAAKIHKGFVMHVADYPAPQPTTPAFLLHVLKLKRALAAWGTKGNRGSHKDYVALKLVASEVRDDLRRLAAYSQNTRPNDGKSWNELGFILKIGKQKPQPLQQVRNFRRFISRSIPVNQIKLKWSKPSGTDEKTVRVYVIQGSDKGVYPRASFGIPNLRAIVTETTYTDMDPMPGQNWYWVSPFNAVGMGVTSEPVMVIIPNTFD